MHDLPPVDRECNSVQQGSSFIKRASFRQELNTTHIEKIAIGFPILEERLDQFKLCFLDRYVSTGTIGYIKPIDGLRLMEGKGRPEIITIKIAGIIEINIFSPSATEGSFRSRRPDWHLITSLNGNRRISRRRIHRNQRAILLDENEFLLLLH